MKAIVTFLSVILISLVACERGNDQGLLPYLTSALPGDHIQDMEIDNNNIFYFVTSEIDTSVDIPMWSSSLPSRFYLSRRVSEFEKFEVVDDNYITINEILFDNNNYLWALNAKVVYFRNGETNEKIIELPDDYGLFQFITVDHDNNIWVGGLRTGLYKIDNQRNITLYNTENSMLPTNSMTNIHIDSSNNKWIALWNNKGVLEITKDNWIFHNSANSNITSQNIWCIVTDKEDNVWVGTGHDDENQSLMKYDGQNWEIVNPKNDNNELVKGTVRKLYSDRNKIYIVSENVENMAFSSNELLTFEGEAWNKIYNIPEDDRIEDLKIDYYRELVWIRTLNKGIFKIPIQ